jgi:hypothetical protein
MQLVKKIALTANHPYFGGIKKLSYISKNVFNAVYYICRKYFFTGKIIDGTEVDPQLKNTQNNQALRFKIVMLGTRVFWVI